MEIIFKNFVSGFINGEGQENYDGPKFFKRKIT
jgi:hypothetical protein